MSLNKNEKIYPYEALVTGASVSLADTILSKGWQLQRYPLIQLNNIPWQPKTSQERSWDYHIHCWNMLDSLLTAHSQTNNEKYLHVALNVAIDWLLKQHQFEMNISSFVWYDMAIGLRAYRLAYIIDASKHADIIDTHTYLLLWQCLEQHQLYLANDANIAFHNNHGLYQAAGQLAMGRRFARKSPLMAQAYQQGTQRLHRILQQQFTTEAIHKEHSPDYHRMVYATLNGMICAELITDPDILIFIKNIEEALSWFVLPNQYICNFGDSDYKHLDPHFPWQTPIMQYVVSESTKGTAPSVDFQVFPKSGYFIVKKQMSYLAQAAAFHSRTHKHADDLSFIWCDRGSDILVDAGRYGYIGKTEKGSDLWLQGYWYSDPNRIFCEGTRAHNTLEFNNINSPRRGVKPYGSAIKRWLHIDHSIFAVETEVKQFSSIRHARVLIFKPSQWLIVFDWFHDNKKQPHHVKQWFHAAPGLQVVQEKQGIRSYCLLALNL